ncbi:hypothetical protein COU77_03835 [Candidatus Peregrinibacteria bacterium CG10_big_fil_rev_8_21_14_0_10_49_16]|nr:MAG: hypothetical protein COW95_00785 [Candidatus Peregrinibacteria bacterium CG22_combo_CG10-13_8_21_14_all_49_11]PIR51783.1 MAG: hypothetical protein COU77_03835 [Candidatus Peregrinibacteria bacterium CG10_big_fil_rev_8_21_14_0_10_49_16]
MNLQELVPLGPKTTMRIGGKALWYVELQTEKDVEDIVQFAAERHLPLVTLGGGSNTIFADGVIEAVVAKVVADEMRIREATHHDTPRLVTVHSGKILAVLINELAEKNLDLSPLTGIPGTLGGAIFGNAGQGAGGIWLGAFVEAVTFYHQKQWKTWTREECGFGYRESIFKKIHTPIIWKATLSVPVRPHIEVQTDIDQLLQKRIETQPHIKTGGSCFKSLSDGTPAWKILDAAGFRGRMKGHVQIAEKHANFLLNTGKATFADTKALVEEVRSTVKAPLDVEMRFVGEDGRVVF